MYSDYSASAGGAKTYAMRLISQPGTHDGLAWNDNDKPVGPIGRLAAIALAQGYRAPTVG